MNVGLYTADPAPYRIAAAQRPEIALRTLSPLHPDLADLDAIVIDAAGAPLYSLARASLARGVHVFARPRTALTVRQLVVLREAASRAGRRLRLAGSWGESRPLKSLRRSFHQGNDAARHLRVVRRLPAGTSIDDATFEELAFFIALTDAPVSSVACAQPDSPGPPVARFMTVTAPGLVAAIAVTSLECGPLREAIAAAGTKTCHFAASDDGVHRLTVSASDSGGVIRKTELTQHSLDALSVEVETFLAALDAPHEAASDQRALAAWSRAALLWDAARTSLEHGGAPVPVVERALLTNTNPPPLRLIVGGGTDGPAHARPTLTVVR
jgi:hypothetical protein